MRVAIDTSHAARGRSGTAVYVERLVAALRQQGVDVVELRQPARLARGGRNKARSAVNAALDAVWTRELLPRAAERARADVLHHPLPAWSPTAIPQIVTVHDVAFMTHPQDFDPVWRTIARRGHRKAVQSAAAVVCVSRATARDAIAWLRARPDQIVLAPHGPGQAHQKGSDPVWCGGGDSAPFLYVGDDEPRKNVGGLLDAHARYRELGGSRALVLAGSAARRDPVPGVDLVPHPELPALYGSAAALVHAARDEGFGLTLLEAMAAGVPVVAVRNAAVEELCDGAALVVEAAELADAMVRVDRDDGLRKSLSRAGAERAQAFSWERSAKAHVEAYTLARR